MSERRHTRVQDELMRQAAAFIERESNRESLITVTSADLSSDRKRATVRISVLPIEREEQVLDFLTRHTRDFRSYLSKHTRMQYIPRVWFEIDKGEQNRRRIDELLRNQD